MKNSTIKGLLFIVFITLLGSLQEIRRIRSYSC